MKLSVRGLSTVPLRGPLRRIGVVSGYPQPIDDRRLNAVEKIACCELTVRDELFETLLLIGGRTVRMYSPNHDSILVDILSLLEERRISPGAAIVFDGPHAISRELAKRGYAILEKVETAR